MSVHQSEALTLRTYPYAESHKIAVFLTPDFGQVRGVAHGAKKVKSRFGSSLEPLTHSRLTFSRKEGQELSVIRECEIIRAFPAYRLSLEVNLYFSYFAELLLQFGKEEQEAENLFRLTLALLDAVEEKPIQLLARYFELWLLQLEGVLPALSERLPSRLAEKTAATLKEHPTQLDPGCLTGAELKRLERLSEELIECHLERRLKAKRMLKELL
ncbi:MAG: DNA repair protein RecO [Acidobacteriota bacterium]